MTQEQLEAIRRLREECRVDGGGGQCSVVAEELELAYGWHIASGVYTTFTGEIICEAHVWNVLPDGSILDGTADQFGEGFDVRVVPPSDPSFRRYRMEWYGDWNPDVAPDECPKQLGCSNWMGELDFAQSKRLRQERGHGWWLADRSALDAYLVQEVRYDKLRGERLAAYKPQGAPRPKM